MGGEPPDVDALLERMTLREKLAQLAGHRGWHALTPASYRLAPFPTPDVERLAIKGLRFTDGPRGINLGRATAFPAAIARGASWDPELEERVGRAMALEAWHQGANAVGAACVNLVRHPGWGRTQETFGADPVHVGAMGAALVRGLQTKVMAVVKHFACNSIENTRFRVSVEIDDKTLREVYLPHFRECVRAGAAAFMSAYNRVNGTYCGEHEALLTGILRDEWGFDGFVMSDFFLGCRSTAASLEAGLDVEMPQRFWLSPLAVRAALRAGRLGASTVDRAARRVVRQKARFGLIGPRAGERRPERVVACAEHVELALDSARRSIVLLQNEGSLLPLDRPGLRRVAVIGDAAVRAELGSEGSCSVAPPWTITPLEGLRQLLGSTAAIEHVPSSNLEEAQEAARRADVAILCTGLSGRDEGEYFPVLGGGDRSELELPAERIRAIEAVTRANPKTVVVLFGGSAIACGAWADRAPAILMAWYPGMQGGRALAEILLGEVSPSGRLPLTFPDSTSDLPPFDCSSKRVEYGYLHDYRWTQSRGLTPRFPLGHGLTYARVDYRALRGPEERGDDLRFELDLANLSDRDAIEVAQLYVSKPETRHPPHPPRRLVTFARVALAAREHWTVSLAFPRERLAVWTSSGWELERCPYVFEAGPSSGRLPLTTRTDAFSRG